MPDTDLRSGLSLAENHNVSEDIQGGQFDGGTRCLFLAMYPGREKQACRYEVWLALHLLQSHTILAKADS